MDIFKLPNVKVDKQFENVSKLNPVWKTHHRLHETISLLAIKYPTWDFYMASIDMHNVADGNVVANVDRFDVKHDDELLGSLHLVRFRGDRCIGIQNTRVMHTLEHARMKRTTDPAKAVAIVKRYFGKKTGVELAFEAQVAASEYLNNAVYRHNRKLQEVLETVTKAAAKYVRMDIPDQFKAYLETLPNGKKLINELDESYKAETEFNAIVEIHTKARNKEACIVVLLSGTYIVKRGDDAPFKCTDDNLPDYVRNKIGLLKLCEVGHSVSGVGSRVNDQTFLIVIDKEEAC